MSPLSAPQLEPARPTVLRWAIGSCDGPRSTTWRLWGNKKGDIYVSTRSLGDRIKASFHRDGKCQVGFDSKYAETASRRFGVAARHWERWRLPADPVVRVLQICVPHSELRSFADRNSTADVIWLATPPVGSIAVVSILVSPPSITKLELPDGAETSQGAIIVGNLRTSIRTAWMVYAHHPMDPVLAKVVDDERMKLTSDPRAANSLPGSRAMLWEHKEGHDRHVLELACL